MKNIIKFKTIFKKKLHQYLVIFIEFLLIELFINYYCYLHYTALLQSLHYNITE